jgi:DNA-binding FadR family transcriptional regulator
MAKATKGGSQGAGDERPRLEIQKRRTPKRAELIAHDLADYIVDSGFAPGTSLPPEHEMIESLGVGRTTVREALRLLETRGVLTIKSGPGGGPVVRRPKPDDLAESLTLILQFEEATLLEIVEARKWLEPAICRLAATKITSKQVQQLRDINAEIAENPEDQDLLVARNRDFHTLIAQVGGNVVLRIFLESIASLVDGKALGIEYGPRQAEGIAVAHEPIIEALAAGDSAAAGIAMNEHLDESERYWRRRFGSVMSRPVRWSEQ